MQHGGVQDAGYGSGLSFKDPDELPLEIFCSPVLIGTPTPRHYG